MIRDIAIFLVRSGEDDIVMKERFPRESNRFIIRVLRKLCLGKAFRWLVHTLSNKRSTAIYNYLINKFRIPCLLVPPKDLQDKFVESLFFLKNSISNNTNGDYLEFGVYQGTSLACMYNASQKCGQKNMRFFGFDSFEGLPQAAGDKEEQGKWTPGQFMATKEFAQDNLKAQGVDLGRVELIKGFFNETLNQRLIDEYKIAKASVIMIDCDMYMSAKQALDFCANLIKDEAVILFDDWNSTDESGGEKRAFSEFLEANKNLKAEEFGTYYSNAKVFKVSNNGNL